MNLLEKWIHMYARGCVHYIDVYTRTYFGHSRNIFNMKNTILHNSEMAPISQSL